MDLYRFSAKINKEYYSVDVYADDLNKARENAVVFLVNDLHINVIDLSELKEENEKFIGISNFKMGIHQADSRWYRYIFPKRLTMISNPPVYKWLFWWIAPKES
jgi:tRNA U38,U39,U40 pseudouridine synthase TruA